MVGHREVDGYPIIYIYKHPKPSIQELDFSMIKAFLDQWNLNKPVRKF